MELSAEERQTCREALKGLLGTIYQPIVVKELLILQNGSKKVSACLEYCSTGWWPRWQCRDGPDDKYRGVGDADTHGSVNYLRNYTVITITRLLELKSERQNAVFSFSGSQKASDVQPRSYISSLILRF